MLLYRGNKELVTTQNSKARPRLNGGPTAPDANAAENGHLNDTHTAVTTHHRPRAAADATLPAVPEILLTSSADCSMKNTAISLGSL